MKRALIKPIVLAIVVASILTSMAGIAQARPDRAVNSPWSCGDCHSRIGTQPGK